MHMIINLFLDTNSDSANTLKPQKYSVKTRLSFFNRCDQVAAIRCSVEIKMVWSIFSAQYLHCRAIEK